MRSFRSSFGWALALASSCVLSGCAPEPDGDRPVVLETEEIGPAPVEEFDLSTDRKAARRASTSGKLPGGFPEGLPVYKPSTISDIGQEPTGDFVQFMSQDAATKVRAWYPAALARAGWSVESGPAGGLAGTRGGRRVGISIETSGPVTLIRVVY